MNGVNLNPIHIFAKCIVHLIVKKTAWHHCYIVQEGKYLL
jgi:hypothetical protein